MYSLKRGVNPFSRVVRQFIVHEDASVVWADRPWVLSPAFQEESAERVWNKSAKLQVPLVKFTLVFTEEMIQLLIVMSCLIQSKYLGRNRISLLGVLKYSQRMWDSSRAACDFKLCPRWRWGGIATC
jgi:hypothetical protein